MEHDFQSGHVYRLEDLRQIRGLRREDLAERARVGITAVAAWERVSARDVPDAEKALRLCLVLDAAPEQILEISPFLHEEIQKLAEIYGLSKWLARKSEAFDRTHGGGPEARVKAWNEAARILGMGLD